MKIGCYSLEELMTFKIIYMVLLAKIVYLDWYFVTIYPSLLSIPVFLIITVTLVVYIILILWGPWLDN